MLGEASYSLYILHVPVAQTLEALGLQTAGWAYFAAYLLLMVSLSVLVFMTVETPARRAIRRLRSPHPALPGAARMTA